MCYVSYCFNLLFEKKKNVKLYNLIFFFLPQIKRSWQFFYPDKLKIQMKV